ncbi:MAG: type II secretion system F family protein [Actinomycetota bacterium]|nr:type II secretion system F family protein [Acidimicrobiia bacterium]MDQ3293789.1 type II secretion system F family protein [Actinomycetota bacterium]
MPRYTYTAIDAAGVTVSGVLQAGTLPLANNDLYQRDLHPLAVEEKKSVLQFEITKKKVKRKDLMHFARQLAVFVRSGIPILEGLEVIGEETPSKVLRRVLDDMGVMLRGGARFADAAAAHPEAFPVFFLSVLRSAELTGQLDTVLEQLADYIEREVDARSKVTSAMVYPAIVFGMAIMTALVLTVFVIPKFETFFASLDAELPISTRMLLAISGFVGTWGWLVGIIVGLAIGGLFGGVRTRRGRDLFDHVKLRMPFVAPLVRAAILERFCRVLGSMVAAGVALPDALSVSADVCNNARYRKGLRRARDAMLRGEGLAGPLAATGLFPPAARQMIRVGEDTGTLEEQLASAATYFDRELDVKIKKFTSLFEPAVILFMGVVVGFVAVAMVSAMYGIFNQAQEV